MTPKQVKYLFIFKYLLSIDIFIFFSKVVSLFSSAGQTVAWNLAKLAWCLFKDRP